jgi:hypothetical protein
MITTYKHLEKNYSAAARDLERLKSTFKKRVLSYLLFATLFPYFIFLRILLMFSGIFSKQLWKKNASKLLRHYLRIYFKFKGVMAITTSDIPDKTERPMIIFTLRRDTIVPFYLYSLFPYPIILPLHKKFQNKKTIHFFPLRTKKLFETISYPDINLGQNLSNIEKMLDAGHSVLVNINHQEIDPVKARDIYFYKAFETLLKKDVDIYFLQPREIRQIMFSSLLAPIIITNDLVSKETLLEGLPADDKQRVFQRIATFFGFTHYFFQE